ncbi:MAG: endo-1,4-beta-xylanase [Jaaginema sp. PMC 1079.18]|nr:endo-1,4-beta-xylanase [Jaaginema sp. PMC 1080.18]MEC4853673.1 endo-1,4-beta-xylanase [Jaaginema sp. PMC 1079.18]MEC4867839.1 endo-1,4-beta-xylanase [Jaaginema sp. PMC 1078.18]
MRKLLLFFVFLFLSACAVAVVETNTVNLPDSNTTTPQNQEITLRSLADRKDFGIGAAAALGALRKDSAYRQVLGREFNQIMPENTMKFQSLQPERDRFNFKGADEIVAFANEHNMRMFGHTLVWQRGLADWLKAGDWTREELLDILRNHIQTVVSRYRGRVYAWDVVNEALDTDSSLRELIWSRGIGPEYIELSYRWTKAADPNAKLFYNEYDPGGWGAKSGQKVDALYRLLADLKERDVPLDGVGLQMHLRLDDAPTYEGLKQNLERLAQLNLQIQITETDVRIGYSNEPSPEQLQQQGEIYSDLIRACLDVPQCTGFWFWGFSDRYTWVSSFMGQSGAPLIFDEYYRPKPAYDAVAQALENAQR